MKYCQILKWMQQYSFSKELGSISGSINLNDTRYTYLSGNKYTVDIVVTDTINI